MKLTPEDRVIDAENQVAEKMTDGLLVTCPYWRCNARFYKEDGCNRVTCTLCKRDSCYVCKRGIKGYAHFHEGKCPLWPKSKEDDKARNSKNVADAEADAWKRVHTFRNVRKG
jgi:hypothetical protein